MTGEEKLSSELFYVQDLRRVCPTCEREEDISVHEGFTFYWGMFPSADIRMIAMSDVNKLENKLRDNEGTIILHLGALGLMPNPKPKRRLGQPMVAFHQMDIEKAASGCQRLFTNNLYQNVHDKVYPLPLGITRKEIVDFKHLRKNNKEHFCYANFSITHTYRSNVIQWASTQEQINCRFTRRFPEWDNELAEKTFADDPLPFDEFLSTLASHKFCIAPNGVGIDTDRLWECIFMNVVPIVQNNYGNRIFSKIWPMILVDMYEFSDIPKLTAEFEKQHGKNIQYNHDLLLRKNLPELMDRIEHECRAETR
jgi:hypothetical protein